MTVTEDKLTERVNRLERQNRWLKIGAAVIAVAVLAVVLMGQAPGEKVLEADTVKAKEFRVVDDAGKVWATLDARIDGMPILALYDAAGERRVELVRYPDGTVGLELDDATGERRAELSMYAHGGPGLKLYNAAGKIRAVFGSDTIVHPTGAMIKCPEGTVTLFNPDGDVIWQAP